jgi:hypothetical protein
MFAGSGGSADKQFPTKSKSANAPTTLPRRSIVRA